MSDAVAEIGFLVEQHYQLLYRYAYRLSGSAADAEDLTQQAFLTAQQKLNQLRDVERAKSWLLTILRNIFLKSVRGQKAGTVSLDAIPETPHETKDDVDFDSERLQMALNDLPSQFRVPLVLYYFDEFSYREIAEQLDVPIGTVMSRLARGKSHLRARLASVSSPQSN